MARLPWWIRTSRHSSSNAGELVKKISAKPRNESSDVSRAYRPCGDITRVTAQFYTCVWPPLGIADAEVKITSSAGRESLTLCLPSRTLYDVIGRAFPCLLTWHRVTINLRELQYSAYLQKEHIPKTQRFRSANSRFETVLGGWGVNLEPAVHISSAGKGIRRGVAQNIALRASPAVKDCFCLLRFIKLHLVPWLYSTRESERERMNERTNEFFY